MIKLSTYNVRGLNKKPKQAYFKQFIADNHISFVGLIETRVKQHNALKISRAICKPWKWHFNYDFHYNGRIWVGWDPSIWHVDIIFISSQIIHCKLTHISNNIIFFVSTIYGSNNTQERRLLWNDLLSCHSSSSWCLLGDFNVIRRLSEAEGGDATWDQGMGDFNDCLESLGVDDIRGVGPLHTWWNCQEDNPIHRKLDRAMGNSAWLSNMTNAQANYGPRGLSDHAPIILNTGILLGQVRKPFQFFNFMLETDGFMDCIHNVWSTHIPGNPFKVLTGKLKLAKAALIQLNTSLGNLSSSVNVARQELHLIQNLLHSNPLDHDLLTRERHCSQTL